jgi:hypothetical protein
MSLKNWIREHVVDWDPNHAEQVSDWDRKGSVGTEDKDGAK